MESLDAYTSLFADHAGILHGPQFHGIVVGLNTAGKFFRIFGICMEVNGFAGDIDGFT